MIYGNVFLPKKEESMSMIEFGIESIAYNEYHNYKSLLEACTDESAKPVLEAQVQILYEVSFKDIINNIIKGINTLIEKVKELFEFIKTKFSEARLNIIEKRIHRLQVKREKIIGLPSEDFDFEDEEWFDADEIESEIYPDLYEENKDDEKSTLKFNEDKFKEIEEKNRELAEELVKSKAKIKSGEQISESAEKKLASVSNKISKMMNQIAKVASNPRLYFYASDFINENSKIDTFMIYTIEKYFKVNKDNEKRQKFLDNHNYNDNLNFNLDSLTAELKEDIDNICIFNDNAIKNVFKCEKNEIPSSGLIFGLSVDNYLKTKVPKGKISLKDFILKLDLNAKNTRYFSAKIYKDIDSVEKALNHLKHIISSEFKISSPYQSAEGIESGLTKVTDKESTLIILQSYRKLQNIKDQLVHLLAFCNKCSGLQEGTLSVLEPIYGIMNDKK